MTISAGCICSETPCASDSESEELGDESPKPPARGRRGVPRQRPTSESELETKVGGRMSCAHTSQHLLKMLRLPLRSASAFSPSRIHRFTTGHTARKSLGLSVFCFINRSVSWDPCSWVEPSVETPGGPAPAPADSSPPGEQTRQLCVTSDSTQTSS